MCRGITKVSFAEWLKRSPAEPKYETSQKKGQTNVKDEGFEKHVIKYFYPENLLEVPEFVYENREAIIKNKEVTILEEYLAEKEAALSRIQEEEASRVA